MQHHHPSTHPVTGNHQITRIPNPPPARNKFTQSQHTSSTPHTYLPHQRGSSSDHNTVTTPQSQKELPRHVDSTKRHRRWSSRTLGHPHPHAATRRTHTIHATTRNHHTTVHQTGTRNPRLIHTQHGNMIGSGGSHLPTAPFPPRHHHPRPNHTALVAPRSTKDNTHPHH